MVSPERQSFDYVGCYLEVVPQGRLVWTNALLRGLRPVVGGQKGPVDFCFTARLTFTPFGPATRYGARVMHSDAAVRKQHQAMGFPQGWGQALDQLLSLIMGV